MEVTILEDSRVDRHTDGRMNRGMDGRTARQKDVNTEDWHKDRQMQYLQIG